MSLSFQEKVKCGRRADEGLFELRTLATRICFTSTHVTHTQTLLGSPYITSRPRTSVIVLKQENRVCNVRKVTVLSIDRTI